MHKAVSSLTLGVGFMTLLAWMPRPGLAGKGETHGARETATGAIFKAETGTLRMEAQLQACVGELPAMGAPTLHASILTLPDPQHTSMAFWFDLRLRAVQRAFGDMGYLPRSIYLPWAASNSQEGREGLSSSYPHAAPGFIWFNKERSNAGPSDAHVLFIVGESQTLGLNREAMTRALASADRLLGTGTEPITLIGPQFSGSLTSLGQSLNTHFQQRSPRPLRLQGTTTLDARSISKLQAMTGDLAGDRLAISPWTSNLSGPAKEQLLDWYIQEAGWPDASKLAIFTESNTVYMGDQQVKATRILFPMGLSRLRAERTALTQNSAKAVAEAGLSMPSTLLGPGVEDPPRGQDTLPQFASDTTRNTELTLASTVLSLSRRGYTHIGISASDPEDILFLAERIRAYHPSCTLFTLSGNHLLFAHPNYSPAMNGMVMVGGFPLTDSMRALSLLEGDLESPVHFTSEGEYAAYYATLFALEPARITASQKPVLGSQGFISVVKNGNIWPLRQGGLLESKAPPFPWKHDVDPLYQKIASVSPDLNQYVHSRMYQLSLLLLLLGGTAGWVFLRPLDQAHQAGADGPPVRPYEYLTSGALLALAIVSLLAVGYLLPLPLLLGSPWSDPHLWTSLIIWAVFCFAVGRALLRRLGPGWTLLLLLLALGPAAGSALWARQHLLTFIPFYLRFTSPGRGVSLMPALVLLTAGLALLLRTWFDMKRQDHGALWPEPQGASGSVGQRLRHFRGLHFQPWIFGLVLLAQLLHRALSGGLVRPLLEGTHITIGLLAMGSFLLFAALFLFWQLLRGWTELRRLLQELEECAYLEAFAEAGRLVKWNAMRALGRGLRTHASSQRGRELLALQEPWMAARDATYPVQVASMTEVARASREARWSANEFTNWRTRIRLAGLMSTCGDSLIAAWTEDPVAAHRNEVHLFLALRATSLIREAFLAMRYLLIGSLGSMLLLLLATAAFDFQPKLEVMGILSAVLLTMAGWATLSILQMERSPLLSRLEGTDPGQIKLSFGLVENALKYVVVPLLLLLGTLNPTMGGFVVQVFNPLMHLLQ